MLGGGPASQHPRSRSQQIRGALPRVVTALSSRYPQLLRLLMRFFTETRLVRAVGFARAVLDAVQAASTPLSHTPEVTP
jgi:hypothetical protein